MFDRAIKNQVKFDYVLADSWFSAKATFKHIRKANKHFIFALKSNRLVALTADDREKVTLYVLMNLIYPIIPLFAAF